ncbi:MAG: hypothetical protein JKY67_21725 [Pseudomonadales bacterium]|nr:hypothetical protein [Pseudomonadales bacterium]
MGKDTTKEGSLEAPTRHPIDWKSDEFYNQESLNQELERVFDVCHGCRRCVSLCQSFPTLFDLVDESETLEVDGIDKNDYAKVVDQCYLCDMCYMSKCPYVPPHEWNIDYPHLMLRSKANNFKKEGASLRDKVLSSTTAVAKLASIPVVDVTVNTLNQTPAFRLSLEKIAGIHHKAPVPQYHSKTLRKRVATYTRANAKNQDPAITAVNGTTGKLALYATCYGNYNSPEIGEDFFKVFTHNNIKIDLVPKEQCCGMPKMELGDLEAVEKLKNANIPVLAALVDQGYDLTAPIPSCVLMYKQELPLLFPEDEQVQKVKKAFFDPFEYLFLRHKKQAFNTEFKNSLGDISYHVACHLRVQNIGLKTRDILSLIPDTTVQTHERCSGHDGTYAVKKETYDSAVKIAKPIVKKLKQTKANYFASDCPMAANHLATLAENAEKPEHPMTLLRLAYDL